MARWPMARRPENTAPVLIFNDNKQRRNDNGR
jgi:hypothetical protein